VATLALSASVYVVVTPNKVTDFISYERSASVSPLLDIVMSFVKLLPGYNSSTSIVIYSVISPWSTSNDIFQAFTVA
jgi:hypothetical protein